MRKLTQPRTLITEQLKADSTFATAQTIFKRLQAQGKSVGIATVYRNLQAMAADGDVDSLHQEGETYYRLCADRHHHHHVICRRCGRTVEVEIPDLEKQVQAKAESLGFSDVTHALEIFGLCAQCQAELKREHSTESTESSAAADSSTQAEPVEKLSL